ncbi:MAG: hypothetical protein M1823_001692 [Watsoniomyces obsoletus]|nr:MAG: hypothetical protein M1823_001692 [Watsoniomyces obsoletus]
MALILSKMPARGDEGILMEPDQIAIVKSFWNHDLNGRQLVEYRSYFRFYRIEIHTLYLGVAPKKRAVATIPSCAVNEICLLVSNLSDQTDNMRPAIRLALRNLTPFSQYQDIELNHSVDLVLRLWLMLNVRDRSFRSLNSDTPPLEWDDKQSLKDFVASQFPKPKTTSHNYLPRLGRDFTAVKMARLSGITIKWTSCLADHLNFDHWHRSLKVYPYKRCLLDHLHRSDRCPIPKNILEETLLTLDLLFPYWDGHTQLFLKKEDHDFSQYGPYNDPLGVDLDDFAVWRYRLLRLYDVYNSPPVGWRQMWYDRRNVLQWYTFWLAAFIALLTVVFGTISSVTSVIQARAALKSLREP